MTASVLVVDDNAEFARSAADLIASRTGLPADSAATPDAACGLVEQRWVAVAVLDERMPVMSGTELLPKLLQLRPDLRVIMLTGEANAEEVHRAYQIGYHDYLHKSRIVDLPERVAAQYLKHLIVRQADTTVRPDVIWPRGPVSRRLRRTEIRLIAVEDLGPQEVDAGSWITVLQLNVGEERRLRYEVSRSFSRTLEVESERALRGSLKLTSRALAAAMASVLESTERSRVTGSSATSLASTRSDEQVLSLPSGDELVRARHFQQAAIKRKTLVSLEVRCKRCRTSSVVPVVIVEDTAMVLTRHQDYLNDGTVRTLDTGVVAAAQPKPV